MRRNGQLGFHPPSMPTRFGFDEFRGTVHNDSDHLSHVDRSGRQDWWHNETVSNEPGYAADLLTQHGVAFIEKNERRPFFLYLPHLSIHSPWQGPHDAAYRQPGQDYNDPSKLGNLATKAGRDRSNPPNDQKLTRSGLRCPRLLKSGQGPERSAK